jgi:hypothetical protein
MATKRTKKSKAEQASTSKAQPSSATSDPSDEGDEGDEEDDEEDEQEGAAANAPPKKPKSKKPPPTSANLDSIEAELRYGGDRAEIAATCIAIAEHLRTLGLPDHYWDYIEIGRGQKKNFAQRFSNALAQKVADALRKSFPDILPSKDGKGHESKSGGGETVKKLDVNYSTKGQGLGLAVSIKTINFRDEKTRRFTKNVKRADGELRAEAQDCHKWTPYAVLAAVIFLPREAALDAIDSCSSLYHAWRVFSRRGGRKSHEEDGSKCERVFIGLYESAGERAYTVEFFDVASEPPERGVPTPVLSFAAVIDQIEGTYVARARK